MTAQPKLNPGLADRLITLLTQAAAGMMTATFLLGLLLNSWQAIKEDLLAPASLSLLATLLGILVAFLHLGSPRNAWRMPLHLKKSWLSRELLMVSLFSILNLFLVALLLYPGTSGFSWAAVAGVTCLLGLILVWFEHSVYRLHSVAVWDSWRTLGEFISTSIILGSLTTGLFVPLDLLAGIFPWLAIPAVVGMLVSFALQRTNKKPGNKWANDWHAWLLLSSMLILIQVVLLPGIPLRPGLLLIFIPALAGETIGRMEFYSRRKPNI